MNRVLVIDALLEKSGLARRVYGLKLFLKTGLSDTTKWFLFNRHALKYSMPLNEKGLVVDIGGYNGDWSLKLLNLNPGLNFKIYEPVRTYFEESQKRFQGYGNVEVFNQAISSDGRKIQIHIDGPRSKLEINQSKEYSETLSILDLFRDLSEIELLKINIEGMEYECLEILIKNNELKKVNNLFVQFHNFNEESLSNYNFIVEEIKKDFALVFRYEWIWEHWKKS
jgi:FkbM family methyltransferase